MTSNVFKEQVDVIQTIYLTTQNYFKLKFVEDWLQESPTAHDT